jgi:penicillin-binding protein 1A
VPIRLGEWQPRNYGDTYRGRILVREAVAQSSNSVAVQVQERVGRNNVIRAARDLGITSPLRPEPTLALGSNGVSLIELTAAYAAVAAGRYPIRAHGLPEQQSWFGGSSADRLNRDRAFPLLRDVFYAVANRGTGRAAALSVPTFGKTGTTSDYRDALFVGFAGDLVVGVWVGNDDNTPLPGTAGGGTPARIWRAFMAEALGTTPARPAPAVPLYQADQEANVSANAAEPAAPPEPEPPAPTPAVPEVIAPPPVPRDDEPAPKV